MSKIKIFALGGLNEDGKNMYVLMLIKIFLSLMLVLNILRIVYWELIILFLIILI